MPRLIVRHFVYEPTAGQFFEFIRFIKCAEPDLPDISGMLCAFIFAISPFQKSLLSRCFGVWTGLCVSFRARFSQRRLAARFLPARTS